MTEFRKNPHNPIYGGVKTGTVFDVYVSKTGGQFRMDFSWRPMKSVAVAFSDDGLSWSEPRVTLAPRPESGWEDRISRNCVLKVGNSFRMWYTGQARGYSFIGLAESEDGLNFRRDLREPVLFSERHWEGMSVMNPCVLFEGGIYRMWYSAGETYEPNVLAYAESRDGVNWIKSRINPIFVCDASNGFEQSRIGGCQVVPHPTLGYLMLYIGYRDIDTACVCAAASPDGITRWRRYRGNPIVFPSPDSWDADSCYKPSTLFDPIRGLRRVWYNGRRNSAEYIGEASLTGDFRPEDFS